jgi:hypothetical protein
VELQAETYVLNVMLKQVFEKRNANTEISAEQLFGPFDQKLIARFRQKFAEVLADDVRMLSTDFDDLLDSFLNPT